MSETELERRKAKVEEAKQYLDSVLTNEELHIVMVSMDNKTQTMAIHVINTDQETSTRMLYSAAQYTNTNVNDAPGRAH